MISIIIPLYNRPEELEELLHSLTTQTKPHEAIEVIVVEDGSTITAEQVVRQYSTAPFALRYLTQKNGGPSSARNTGARQAEGEWLLFLDSDTILPPEYLSAVTRAIRSTEADLWGGPDRGHDTFTPIQKAISYSMTAFLTTGGIRGGQKETVDRFYPRTFNMGVRKSVFDQLGGFDTSMRYGEDLDFSMRVIESGHTSALYPDCWLYHKRRSTFAAFFSQVRHSGRARWTLRAKHPGTLKVVHALPSLFVLGCLGSLAVGLVQLPLLYALLILGDALLKGYTPRESVYCVVAAFVQHFGYGIGFIEEPFRK